VFHKVEVREFAAHPASIRSDYRGRSSCQGEHPIHNIIGESAPVASSEVESRFSIEAKSKGRRADPGKQVLCIFSRSGCGAGKLSPSFSDIAGLARKTRNVIGFDGRV